jgi:hypothetical protein
MKETPTDAQRSATGRSAKIGRTIHAMLLFEVKAPEQPNKPSRDRELEFVGTDFEVAPNRQA